MADATGSIPQKIGRYEVQKQVGRGMMGIVYQARDTLLERTVALKTISIAFEVSAAEREAFEHRFLIEARAAARLSHPGIVVVYDVGTDPDSKMLYMALEYLRGKTLESVLAEKQRLDWREALHTGSRIADALHHAHTHGIVHRDIKPANIMVLASGEPKIMDFGVAKLTAAQLTTSGQVMGSPSYMSPEQSLGGSTDARTDVFALGTVLYELLTNKRAFAGPSVPEILQKLAYEDPAPVTRLAPSLPPAADAVVRMAMAKAPESRYASARSFRDDIDDLLAGRAPRTAAPGFPPTTLVAKSGAAVGLGTQVPPPKKADGEGTDRAGHASGAPALPEGRRVSLRILDGERRGEVYVLERPRILIGRTGGGSQADVEVPDPQVSRAHALVECHGTRFVLRDLKSTNGTFVGSARVTEATLGSDEEFRVGQTSFRIVLSDV
jgi:tRNA A-37 threonylcarbamoyl transferase component Bud32